MNIQYDEHLWGKVDFLHERYHREHNYMNHFLEMITKFQLACSDFSKNIKNVLNKNLILADSKESTLYKSMDSFRKCLLTHSQVFNETNESFKSTIIDPITKSINETFLKEKELYNHYTKNLSIYNNSKNSLQKVHHEFENRAKECENLVYNAKKSKMYSLASQEQILKLESKATESIANTALSEDKYINILGETNKARENEINSQKKIQNMYQNIDNDFYSKIKLMFGIFITSLKKMYTGIAIEIDSLADKFNRISIEKDIKDFIEKNKTDAKPDKPICFIPYKPAADSINYSKISSKRKDSVDLDVSLEVIKTFQKIFKHIRTDLNMDDERKKNRLRLLSNQLFKIENNNNFTKKEKDELFGYLKEQKWRNYFIKFLSKLKTKGFKNNDVVLKDLIEVFSHILELSEKEKDYDSAQNCIILSQTIYNENKSKKKDYLIDYIRNNKWINSIEFWEGIIDYMIQKEITKNDEINKNKDEKEKKSNNKNIVFSQVFSYTNNMAEFNIKIEDIISLIEKFSKKYEIEQEMVNSIIDNVNNIQKNKKKEDEKKEKIEEKKTEEKNKEDNKKEDNQDSNKPQKIEIIKDYFSADNEVKENEDEKNEKNNNE
jgi:L-fucose mutarotase/ribose pyranase (RbsD/FucU family)